jgi:hypothetical protein
MVLYHERAATLSSERRVKQGHWILGLPTYECIAFRISVVDLASWMIGSYKRSKISGGLESAHVRRIW